MTLSSSMPTRPGASSGSDRELIDVLNIWARFIYGPLLDDRVRSLADGVKPSEYGRREAFRVHQALKRQGPVTIPREFVFMDRAAIGLGAVFLHLRAELNFHVLFNAGNRGFLASPRERPAGRKALAAVGLDQACFRPLTARRRERDDGRLEPSASGTRQDGGDDSQPCWRRRQRCPLRAFALSPGCRI